MNKAELITKVVDITGLTKRDAEAAVDAVITSIEGALIDGDVVKIAGFGQFEKKTRAPRTGTNPATQEKIEIPAANVIAFKPSKTLKAKIN